MGKKIKLETTERYVWADIVRIIAMYLVVQIHTATPIYSQWSWDYFTKMSVVSIPLFVLLSGSLLLGKSEGYKVFFQKRCLKVLFPWILWTLIYMVYFRFYLHPQSIETRFFQDNQPVLRQWAQYFFQMFLSNLWFLPVIFSLYLIMPIIRIIVKNASNTDLIYLLILWFLTISLVPYTTPNRLFPTWEPNMVFTTVQFSGLLFAGFLLVNKKIMRPTTKVIPPLLLLGFLPLFVPHSYLHGFFNPVNVISSGAIFYLLYIFGNKIDKRLSNKTKKILAKLSGATLGIYIIHQIVFTLLGKNILLFLQPYHGEFLLTMIIFFISAGIVLFLQKLPIIKYIVP